jgi:CheY-like chemotaxis protein
VQAARDRPAPKRRFNVLLCDDHVDTVITLGEILRYEGHKVSMCADPRRALESVVLYNPEVCVLDIEMPLLTGYDLARQIRAYNLDRQPILIAFTAHYANKPSELLVAKAAGFNHVMSKGSDPRELVALLDKLAGRGDSPTAA